MSQYPRLTLRVNGEQLDLTDRLLSGALLVNPQLARFEGQVVLWIEDLLKDFPSDHYVFLGNDGEALKLEQDDIIHVALLSTNNDSWKLVRSDDRSHHSLIEARFVLRSCTTISLDQDVYTDPIFTSIDEALKDPDSVKHLNLADQNLQRVPADIGRFKNLVTLNLAKNAIDDFSEDLCQLPHLEVLKLSRNAIAAIPPGIRKLKALKELHISRNEIERIPDELFLLHKLELLNISFNKLQFIPVQVLNLTQLKTLEVNDNDMSDESNQLIKNLLPEVDVEA